MCTGRGYRRAPRRSGLLQPGCRHACRLDFGGRDVGGRVVGNRRAGLRTAAGGLGEPSVRHARRARCLPARDLDLDGEPQLRHDRRLSPGAVLSALARECGLATNYHNITHPSLPNYVAATSGLSYSALQGFLADCDPGAGCDTSAPSIFGQGETWKAYEESMPSGCYPSNSGEYAVRHNPPAYYTTLHSCSSDDVPYSQLATDLAHDQLPAFSFITPNLIDDMHDGTVADGDTWLSRNLSAILGSTEYRDGSTVVFITWDEGEDGGYASGESCATNTTDVSCDVATLVISPSTKAGTRSGALFNHYSLLATAEQLLGLPKLGLAAAYPTMTKAFNL